MKIELTTDPSLVNATLVTADFQQNQRFICCVESKEDKGRLIGNECKYQYDQVFSSLRRVNKISVVSYHKLQSRFEKTF